MQLVTRFFIRPVSSSLIKVSVLTGLGFKNLISAKVIITMMSNTKPIITNMVICDFLLLLIIVLVILSLNICFYLKIMLA